MTFWRSCATFLALVKCFQGGRVTVLASAVTFTLQLFERNGERDTVKEMKKRRLWDV
jgi:hypothetical protein